MPTNGDKSEAIDPRLVKKLADILNTTDLTEIEVEKGELKIRVARKVGGKQQVVMAPAAAAPVAAPAAPVADAPAPAPAAAAEPAAPAAPAGDVVTSPMVGTAYLQPEPGAPSFVKVGDTVEEGQTILIVEAMKTMNPIPAPQSGTVKEILVKDAEPIEFGAPLIVLG